MFLDKGIEQQYGRARRVWVMDRGIPTEAVLAEMRGATRRCSIWWERRKGVFLAFGEEQLDKPWQEARAGVRSNYWPRTTNFMCKPRASIASAKNARCANGN